MTEYLDIQEKMAHIDQMLADHDRVHTEQLAADRDRKRQEIEFRWQLVIVCMTGAALFAAGIAFTKLFWP